jgi:hypothetical protein
MCLWWLYSGNAYEVNVLSAMLTCYCSPSKAFRVSVLPAMLTLWRHPENAYGESV